MNKEYKTNGLYFFSYSDLGNRTDDIEFMRGKFDDRYHHEDSKYLWLDIYVVTQLYSLISTVIPDFSEYTNTEINKIQWKTIVELTPQYSKKTQDVIFEINDWMIDTFCNYGCVTVLGV